MDRTSKVFSLAVLGALIAVLGTPPLGAQHRRTAEAQLQQAAHHEVVLGELERAIELYRVIVAEYAGDRAVAAKALAYLGRAYEKLGRREAQGAYERVVREYADQAEPVQFARARLQALYSAGTPGEGRRENASPTYTMILGELPALRLHDAPQFDFSPAGDRVVFQSRAVDTAMGSQLLIADRGGALVRPLFRPQQRASRMTPRWSPDGRWIAYVEGRRVNPDSLGHSLYIVAPDGDTPHVVATSLPGIRVAAGGIFWTPDSRAITISTARDLRTVDLEGRVLRVVPFRPRYQTRIAGYSPDGRWIAFHEPNEGSEQEREMDVWILPAEGGRAIQLTHAPGFDGWPTWAPDGGSVYLVSDRSGSLNIWKVNVDPQTGLPQGEAQQITHYEDATILYPKVLGRGTRLAFALVRRTSVIHLAPSSRPVDARTVARGTSPDLSPDGRILYYVGEGTGQEGIHAVSAEGGEPRRLTRHQPGGPFLQPFFPSPDGRRLAYFTRIGSQNALFTVPGEGGEPRELVRFDSREHLVPSWSPDGSRLAYSHGNSLYAIPAAGGEPRKLAQLYAWDGWTVRWSPDGRHVAALAWTGPEMPTQQNAVFVVPAEGGEPRRLTPVEEGGYKEALEWHPDGQRLTYMDYGVDDWADGTRMAYLNGRPTTLLVNQPDPLWDYVGRWAPDGRRFFFISAKSGLANPWGLYVYDDSSRTTSVVWPDSAGTPGSFLPNFSRDGRTMVWSVQREVRQLWVMDRPPGATSPR